MTRRARRRPPKADRILQCDVVTHGAETWRATVRCTACDRVWWLQDHAPAHEQPASKSLVCDCGADLKALGRAICWRCYKSKTAPLAPSVAS